MIRRVLHVAATILIAVAVACSRSSAPSSPAIRPAPSASSPAYVEVTGLSRTVLDALAVPRSAEQWNALLRVGVSEDGPPMLGEYAVRDGTLRFTPAFPFDPGRTYQVRFDGSQLPKESVAGVLQTEIRREAPAAGPTTVVTNVYPSGDEVPENLLRMYIEFSAPMTRQASVSNLRLLDEQGREVPTPFLPLDYQFWSPDARRFTVFFDPGRVKDGILPNEQMGRPLVAGHAYTLVVTTNWRDGTDRPLMREYRRRLQVVPAWTDALTPSAWRVSSPASETRDPLVVTFPQPLDHGLLARAIGVRSGQTEVAGQIAVEGGETRWLFTPDQPWRAGSYDLLALSVLEDPAGNRIGRAFEIENLGSAESGPDAKTVRRPFIVRPRNATD